MERIIADCVLSYLMDNNLLHPTHHGFDHHQQCLYGAAFPRRDSLQRRLSSVVRNTSTRPTLLFATAFVDSVQPSFMGPRLL